MTIGTGLGVGHGSARSTPCSWTLSLVCAPSPALAPDPTPTGKSSPSWGLTPTLGRPALAAVPPRGLSGLRSRLPTHRGPPDPPELWDLIWPLCPPPNPAQRRPAELCALTSDWMVLEGKEQGEEGPGFVSRAGRSDPDADTSWRRRTFSGNQCPRKEGLTGRAGARCRTATPLLQSPGRSEGSSGA